MSSFLTGYTPPKARLVDDLIPLILESSDSWWSCDYARLMRVSPAWASFVRTRLYARPQLHTFDACTLLARTIRENPGIASFITGLDLCPVPVEDSYLIRIDISSIRTLFSVEGLRFVALRQELAVDAERFLRCLARPETLEELIIDGHSFDFMSGWDPLYLRKPARLRWDQEMTSKFPNLCRLRVSHAELSIPYKSPIHRLQLTHLDLDKVTIVQGQLHNLSTSWDELQSLDIIALADIDLHRHLPLLLSSCCSSLRSLHIQVLGTHCEDLIFSDTTAATSAMSFPSLLEVRLSGIDASAHTLQCIEKWCPKLEVFVVLGRKVRVAPLEWVAFLASGALPSLQGFKAPGGTGREATQKWTEEEEKRVMDACVERQVTCY
ncbi:uncharacterized protein STEHIDRAFT_123800 [Stereum hirsutum FP-91666 SS1]|uniref:uncharacterized protein n=1 Tax=Stereum hirsutum (strain FP-91666) TaxID=721885 RepID=UPI00044492F5|nr:uncharacterized protein STEHIDRAFT_123800 [Stereum hirsutum FP-91666 SS1]EIM83364.1 hypothetical protein STEHIDRAFT_123800 [Stereum hirsutum FP-91666 SS1]